jgi:hypothetical protein
MMLLLLPYSTGDDGKVDRLEIEVCSFVYGNDV